MGTGFAWIAWITIMSLGVTFSSANLASAEPLDLSDPTPRWIEVRFEVSPAEEPGSLDRRWGPSRLARFEPITEQGVVRIRIPPEEVERQLRSTGTDTIRGSFSEFVWTLDPMTGHVREAGLTGRVREKIRVGPFRSSAKVDIQVQMTTEGRAGFVPESGLLGIRTNRFCAPKDRGDCVAVLPVRFDPSRGYVNAVGHLRAATALVEIWTFSPLGEVEFRERVAIGEESVVSGPAEGETVCSVTFDRPCPTDHGGES